MCCIFGCFQGCSVWLVALHESDGPAEVWRTAGEADQSDCPPSEQIHGLQVQEQNPDSLQSFVAYFVANKWVKLGLVTLHFVFLTIWLAGGVTQSWTTVLIWVTWRTGPHVDPVWCVWSGAASPSPPSTSARAQVLPPPTSAPTTAWVHLHLCGPHTPSFCVILTHTHTLLHSVWQTCSNEVKCICDPDYTGTDCSVFHPIPTPTPDDQTEKHKGNVLNPSRKKKIF